MTKSSSSTEQNGLAMKPMDVVLKRRRHWNHEALPRNERGGGRCMSMSIMIRISDYHRLDKAGEPGARVCLCV